MVALRSCREVLKMSNRFHSKWHRTSHQTYKNPNILDAGWDPIASHDVPFSGDFVMAPSVSGWCVSAEKNSLGDIYSWSPNNVITIDAHHDPSAEPPDPDNSTINLVAGIINFDISETNINGHLNVRDWVEISGMSGDGDTGYGLIVHESAVVSGNTSAIGDITTDGNLYVTGSEPSAGSAYFKAISASEATIVSALINEVDISASESNGYIMKTPNPQGKEIPDPMSISAGVNNFYLSGDTLYSDSWGYFEGELKTASALYADGPVTFADTLNVSATATFDNEIKAASSITTNKNLYVTGNAKVGAFGSFGTYVSAAGSDNNGYGLIIEKNANIKGNTDIGGTLGVTGAVDFDSTLNVDGATTLNSLGVTNNATVGGTLGVTGATTLSTLNATGAVDFDSTLNVDGATTLNSLGVTNNATVGGTLGVTGATTLSSTLGVTGATTFGNTLGVTGATTLGNTLNVSGYISVAGENDDGYGLITTNSAKIGLDLYVENGCLTISGDDGAGRSVICSNSICVTPNLSQASTNLSLDGLEIYKRNSGIPLTAKYGINSITIGSPNPSVFTYPASGGVFATQEYVDGEITSIVGDINTVLDTINGEVI